MPGKHTVCITCRIDDLIYADACCFVRATVISSSWACTCSCVICMLPHFRIPFAFLVYIIRSSSSSLSGTWFSIRRRRYFVRGVTRGEIRWRFAQLKKAKGPPAVEENESMQPKKRKTWRPMTMQTRCCQKKVWISKIPAIRYLYRSPWAQISNLQKKSSSNFPKKTKKNTSSWADFGSRSARETQPSV